MALPLRHTTPVFGPLVTGPPTGPPRASRYVCYQGKEIFRATGFIKNAGRIHCPGGHRVDFRSQLLEDGFLFCDARPAKGHAPCEALIYVRIFPMRGDDKRVIWLADCTRAERDQINRAGWDADGIVDYFGGSFPR